MDDGETVQNQTVQNHLNSTFDNWTVEVLAYRICKTTILLLEDSKYVPCMINLTTIWKALMEMTYREKTDKSIHNWAVLSNLLVGIFEDDVETNKLLLNKIKTQGDLYEINDEIVNNVLKLLHTFIALHYFNGQNVRKARKYILQNDLFCKEELSQLLNHPSSTPPECLSRINLCQHLVPYIETMVKKLGKPSAFKMISMLAKKNTEEDKKKRNFLESQFQKYKKKQASKNVSTNTEQEVSAKKRSGTSLRENGKETVVANPITESIQNTSKFIDTNIEPKTTVSCNGKNTSTEKVNKSANNEELSSSIGELSENLKTKTTSKVPKNSKKEEAESNINECLLSLTTDDSQSVMPLSLLSPAVDDSQSLLPLSQLITPVKAKRIDFSIGSRNGEKVVNSNSIQSKDEVVLNEVIEKHQNIKTNEKSEYFLVSPRGAILFSPKKKTDIESKTENKIKSAGKFGNDSNNVEHTESNITGNENETKINPKSLKKSKIKTNSKEKNENTLNNVVERSDTEDSSYFEVEKSIRTEGRKSPIFDAPKLAEDVRRKILLKERFAKHKNNTITKDNPPCSSTKIIADSSKMNTDSAKKKECLLKNKENVVADSTSRRKIKNILRDFNADDSTENEVETFDSSDSEITVRAKNVLTQHHSPIKYAKGISCIKEREAISKRSSPRIRPGSSIIDIANDNDDVTDVANPVLVPLEVSSTSPAVKRKRTRGKKIRVRNRSESGESITWSSEDEPPATRKRARANVTMKSRTKNPFTISEEGYMMAGVRLYGVGNWSKILSKYDFHSSRTSVSLKDKFRTMKRQGLF